MYVGLHNASLVRFPSLALLKLAAHHRKKGDSVEWFNPLMSYDKVYSSKIFSWPALKDPYLPAGTVYGGSGYNLFNDLPDEIEHLCPDYSFGQLDYSVGFLTRGCINRCSWCIVPQKEGSIRAHAHFEEFCRHEKLVLLDNNILAHDHGLEQLSLLANKRVKLDINQGLDARLLDDSAARILAKVRWLRYVRLACDSRQQMPFVEKAITNFRKAGGRAAFFCYVLVEEVPSALERVMFLKSLNVTPFAQPFRPAGSTEPPAKELRDFARWVNRPQIFKTSSWKEYTSRGGKKKKSREISSDARYISMITQPTAEGHVGPAGIKLTE